MRRIDRRDGRPAVSVVVPACDEEHNIEPLAVRLARALRGYRYEILFVDDGSCDGTLARIKRLRKANRSVHYVSLSRNFGHQNALEAGIHRATGSCVITIDGDLQHPPEVIPRMIAKWREGYDVVFTIRQDGREVSWLKRVTGRLFYGLVNRISEVHIPVGAADFRLLDRSVVDALGAMAEAPFYRGIVPWMGFRQVGVPFVPARRAAGATKYSLGRMIGFALGGLTSFSVMPLRLATLLGFVMALAGFAIGLQATLEYLLTRNTVPGWTSTIVTVVLVGGVQLLVLGIMGEYLGKLYMEAKHRPHYIVRECSTAGRRR